MVYDNVIFLLLSVVGYASKHGQFCVPFHLASHIGMPCSANQKGGCGGIEACSGAPDCEPKCSKNSECSAYLLRSDEKGWTSFNVTECHKDAHYRTFIKRKGKCIPNLSALVT